MSDSWGKVKDFFSGKKMEDWLIADCSFDLKDNKLINIPTILRNGLNGTMYCNFEEEGGKPLGKMKMNLNVSKNGVKTRIEVNDDLIGAVAKRVI